MLPKLIRDDIPKVIRLVDNKEAVTYVADMPEYRQRLLDKLQEEVIEVREAQHDRLVVLELVDLLEVTYALALALGYTEAHVTMLRNHKAESHGRFMQRLVLTDMKPLPDL